MAQTRSQPGDFTLSKPCGRRSALAVLPNERVELVVPAQAQNHINPICRFRNADLRGMQKMQHGLGQATTCYPSLSMLNGWSART